MSTDNEVYIGDGLYASFDGFTIKLRTEREEGMHYVYLEPAVWASLQEIVRIWYAGLAAKKKGQEQ